MKKFTDHQLYRLTTAWFLTTLREPEVLFWGMIFPVLISIGLGLAFTQSNEEKFRVAVVDQLPQELHPFFDHAVNNDHEKSPDQFVTKFDDNVLGGTTFEFTRTDQHNAIVALKRGDADLVVTDSAGLARFHFDPHNAQAQLAYMKLVARLQTTNHSLSDAAATGNVVPLTLKGVRYIDFLIPGLLAFGIMSSILWGISYTIIEQRSQKLLRRVVATPMKKSHFLIALMFMRIVMNAVEAAVLGFFAWLLFDVQIQGNFAALTILFLAGNLSFTGVAVLISSKTAKTEVGTGWINAVSMPMMILSGIFFSYKNFPAWSIPIIEALPLTSLTNGIRSIFNEGAGWIEIVTPALELSAIGVVCFILGMKMFKWY